MAERGQVLPSRFGRQRGGATARNELDSSCKLGGTTQNSSSNSAALLSADGGKGKDRRRDLELNYDLDLSTSASEVHPAESQVRPAGGKTRRRHCSEPPRVRTSETGIAPLTWAHTSMNSNESMRTQSSRSTMTGRSLDTDTSSALAQDESTLWGDFEDDTSYNFSGPTKLVSWLELSPEDNFAVSHIDEDDEEAVLSPDFSTAEVPRDKNEADEAHVKINDTEPSQEDSCCFETVDVLEGMPKKSTLESGVFCTTEINAIDTFLDIDTSCQGGNSSMVFSTVECTEDDSLNDLTEDTDSSSEEDEKRQVSDFTLHEKPSSRPQRSESAEERDVSEKSLQNYGRESISESNIVKDEMIFQPPSKIEDRLYLGRSVLADNTKPGNGNGHSERKHTPSDETTDKSSHYKPMKTITQSSFSQVSVTKQKKTRSKVYSLQWKSGNDKAKGDDGFFMTESKSNLKRFCASDVNCEGAVIVGEEGAPNMDFDVLPDPRQSLSDEERRREVDAPSLDHQGLESKVFRKSKKGKYGRRVTLACKGRGRRMAERCARFTRHDRFSKEENILARTVRSAMAPILQETRGRITYEKKEGKYICRGARRKPQAQNINFNSGEVKFNIDAKASSFIGEYLFELWKNQCLCDVKLQSQGGSFLAHKIVLAAFSDAFCPCEPVPEPATSVDMPDTTSEAVYQVLLYLYTSEMELSDDSMEDVLNAALFLGVSDVVDLIKDILQNPTKDNFNIYLDIADRLHLGITLMSMPYLIREHLHDIWDSDHFKKLSLDNMITILSDQELMVNAESDILEAVCRWAGYNFPERIPDAIMLMQHVNFVCIDPNSLAKTVEKYEFIFDHKDLQQVLASIYKSFAINSIVKDPSGYFPESNLCRAQKDSQSAVRPRGNEEYRKPVFHPPPPLANPQHPPDVSNPHTPTRSRSPNPNPHNSSSFPNPAPNAPAADPTAGKTPVNQPNPHWQNHPELLMDSKSTSTALASTDRAKLATQQTIMTINQQFNRVFGPNKTATVLDYCRTRRPPRSDNPEEGARPSTPQLKYVPFTDTSEKKGELDFDLRKSYAPSVASDDSRPGSMRANETRPSEARGIDCRTGSCDKLKTSKTLGAGGGNLNEQVGDTSSNPQGAKPGSYAANIRERFAPSPSVRGSRGGMETQRDGVSENQFLDSKQMGGKLGDRVEEIEMPEFGLLSMCPEQQCCSRAIQKRLLTPAVEGISRRSGGGSTSMTSNDKSQNRNMRSDRYNLR